MKGCIFKPFRWYSQYSFRNKAWCCQAPSHHLTQCWLRSSLYVWLFGKDRLPSRRSKNQAKMQHISLIAYGSGKRMVTGTRTGSGIKTENFKRRLLPHHMSQRRDIWCTNSPVISCFNHRFVDRSVPYEAKQRRVKFRRGFGNIPLAAGNVSVTNIGSSGTEPKAPVTDFLNRGSGNHTRG